MNHHPFSSAFESRQALRFYQQFNHDLDGHAPYSLNETILVDLRDKLDRQGHPGQPCYWLLVARLAEMTLLCADNYAACGEITAAGDLMINPRNTHIHMKGAVRPIVKSRHGRLSDQLEVEMPADGGFIDWCKHNALVQVVEPALLPDFEARLAESGFLSKDYLQDLRTRMGQVADAMRFAMVAGGRHCVGEAGEPSCGVDAWPARRLGCEVARTCSDPAYQSAFLVCHGLPEASAPAMAEPLFRSLTA